MTDAVLRFRRLQSEAPQDGVLQFLPETAGAQHQYTLIIPEGSATHCLIIPYDQSVSLTGAPKERRDRVAGSLTSVDVYAIRGTVKERRDRVAGQGRYQGRTSWNIGDITERRDRVAGVLTTTSVSQLTGDVKERRDTTEGRFHVEPFSLLTGTITERRDRVAAQLIFRQIRDLVEGARGSAQYTFERAIVLIEQALAQAEALLSMQAKAALVERAAASGRVYIGFTTLIQESGLGSDTLALTSRRVLALADSMLGAGVVSTTLEAKIALALTAIARDHYTLGKSTSLIEAATGLDVPQAQLWAYIYAVEQAIGEATLQPTLTLYVTLTEGAIGTDTHSILAALTQSILEGGLARAVIRLGDEVYVGWVMNTETGALSQYSDFAFNSMTRLGNHFYGATDAGIHLLEGETDEGNPILSRLKTGLLDLGDPFARKMSTGDVYLIGTAEGELYLRVMTTGSGGSEGKFHQYRVTVSPLTGSMKREIGRGLSGFYWQFELESVGDIELNAVEFFPIILDRRI